MNSLKPPSPRLFIISFVIVMAFGMGAIAMDPYPNYDGVDHTAGSSAEYFSDPILDNVTRSNVTTRYLQNMSREGPTGKRFALQDAGFRNGTLVVRAQLAPQSLYPIYETISGIETEFFQHYDRYPRIDAIVQEVTNCGGDVIAREIITRGTVHEFWNESANSTGGNYTELESSGYEGVAQLTRMPHNWTTPQDTWTCRDWERANPNLTAIGGV